MLNNSRKSPRNGTPLHRVPQVADQPGIPLDPCTASDEQTENLPDLAAFKVFMKRNMPYQAVPEGALAELRARIADIQKEQ